MVLLGEELQIKIFNYENIVDRGETIAEIPP